MPRSLLRRLYDRAATSSPGLARFMLRVRAGRLFDAPRKRIRGTGNRLDCRDALLSRVTFDIVGDDNHITIGADSRLTGVTFHLRGSGQHVTIGKGCIFSQGGVLWLEDDGAELEIGDGCTFEDVHLAVTEPGSRMTIGPGCMFAYDIEVRTGDSHSIIDAASGERINPAADVTIGSHVWVTVGAKLLKGARIANDCVVGTGSVVTGSFDEPGCIIAGSPAQVVRTGVDWRRERV